MSVPFIRIDSRLVHGQIIEAWLPYLKTNTIIVINDNAAENPIQRTVMEMSVPKQIKIKIYSLSEAINNLNTLNNLDNCLILFSSLQDAYKIYNSGFRFDLVNIGNLHFCHGKKQVSKTVCLSSDEIILIKNFDNAGLKIFIQSVPSDKSLDVKQIWDTLT